MKNKSKVFSGIQPSGSAHIGNYLGAIKGWAENQAGKENIFCIVDLHTITMPQDPSILSKNILETAKIIIASGVDPKKSSLFVQSNRPEHAELAWILNCNTQMGELARMTQYKDKGKGKESASVALFDYPVLMAADILLYDTNEVPVGEDQKQHVELTRILAKRMNSKYGEGTVIVPESIIKNNGARIMSLDNPNKKMTKSADRKNSYIALRDTPEEIRKKLKKAVTDSGSEIEFTENKPALRNLLTIFSSFTEQKIVEIATEYQGKGYAKFKADLAEVVINGLMPIQKRLKDLDDNPSYVAKVLTEGNKKVAPIAEQTLLRIKSRIGLG